MLLTVSFGANAALSFNVDSISGNLTSIDNLLVDSKVYNVSFVKGTFDAIYGGTFDFNTIAKSTAAAHALLSAITSEAAMPIGVAAYPAKISGLWDDIYMYGEIFIPDHIDNIVGINVPEGGLLGGSVIIFNNVNSVYSLNYALLGPMCDPMATCNPTFAKFTPVPSSIPIPAAIWLFGSVLTGLVGFGRHKSILY